VPEVVIPEEMKARAFDPAITLLKEVHEKHGWTYEVS
jgi:hypothetical protein